MNKKIWHKNKTPSAHLAPKLKDILNFHTNQNHMQPLVYWNSMWDFFF